VRLSLLQRIFVYGSFLGLAFSGYFWLVLHYFAAVPSPFGSAPHPLESWMLAAPGAAAFLFLIIFGSLFPIHIASGLKTRRNVRSGITLLVFLLILTVSGYLLYYAGIELIRDAAWWSHIVLGVMIPIVLVVHVVLGRRQRQRLARLEITPQTSR